MPEFIKQCREGLGSTSEANKYAEFEILEARQGRILFHSRRRRSCDRY